MKRLELIVGLSLALAAPALTFADDPPAKPDAKKKKKDEPDTFLKVSEVKCTKPPLIVHRPSDSWQFINLEYMKKLAARRGNSTAGYATLRARLWFGAYKANIFVNAWVDRESREKPLTLIDLYTQKLNQFKGAFENPKLKKPKGTRIGKQKAIVFELSGKLKSTQKPHFLMIAVTYREADKAIGLFRLERAGDDKKKEKELRKAFKKLLKKAKF